MNEEWRPVVGFEGLYEVSDQGGVRRLAREVEGRRGVIMRFPAAQLAGAVTAFGYRRVSLRSGDTRSSVFVHVLVLEAFVGPQPAGTEACHGNGQRLDNVLSNLRWDTRSENQRDSVRHGTHSMSSRTECPQGHPYNAENTYITPRGSRNCRACNRAASARHAQNERTAA